MAFVLSLLVLLVLMGGSLLPRALNGVFVDNNATTFVAANGLLQLHLLPPLPSVVKALKQPKHQ